MLMTQENIDRLLLLTILHGTTTHLSINSYEFRSIFLDLAAPRRILRLVVDIQVHARLTRSRLKAKSIFYVLLNQDNNTCT